MKHQSALLMVAIVAAGCTSMNNYATLQHSGALRVERAEVPEYQYKVHIKNLSDFDWDPDARADREKAMRSVLAQNCTSPQVVDESYLDTGTYLTGKPIRTYTMKVKCA